VAPSGRLAAERGRAAAVALRTAFLADLAETCRRWRAERVGVDPNRRIVFVPDADEDDIVVVDLAARAGARVARVERGGPGIASVVHDEFDRGARSVVVLAPAAPTLPVHLVDHAFRALQWERCVLGPTFVGGLWLLGVQRGAPLIVPEAPWSTPQTAVLLASRWRARGPDDAPAHLLPFWFDVAGADDVERLVWHVRATRAADPDTATATWSALARLGLVDDGAAPRKTP
jgi:glycosyltransferase A (GT-A) superfamily protein (DUF2064 family)